MIMLSSNTTEAKKTYDIGKDIDGSVHSEFPDTSSVEENVDTKEKNLRLLIRAQAGDKKASDELILSNLGLVRKIAIRFRDRGTEFEDLVQIGTIGMLKAVKSFDTTYGTAFSTYAVPLIIGEIRKHLRDDGIIKISRQVKRNGMILLHAREKFISENGREPKISELSEICGLTDEDVSTSLNASCELYSLSSPVGDDDTLTLEGTIAESDDIIGGITDKIALSEAITELEPLHRKIITLRYFRNMSQQQTGKILGLSQVKISREEKKILDKLRSML